MKKYRIYKLCILLTLLLTVDAQAQQVNQFSVQQAIEYAKKNAVHVKNALLDVLIQKANKQGYNLNSHATDKCQCRYDP
jgi:uncharacterized membrane protein